MGSRNGKGLNTFYRKLAKKAWKTSNLTANLIEFLHNPEASHAWESEKQKDKPFTAMSRRELEC